MPAAVEADLALMDTAAEAEAASANEAIVEADESN